VGKTKAKWLNRDVADPDHVGAETLPFDAASTIKEKTTQIYGGVNKLPEAEPADASLALQETVLWYDTASHLVRRKHKDATGAVRVMSSEAPSFVVMKKSANYTAADHEVVIGIAAVYITLKNEINATIVVKNGSESEQVVVLPESGTIDGMANYSLTSQYTSATFVCDGVDWWVI